MPRRELPGGRLGPSMEVDGRTFTSFTAGLHDAPALTGHAGVSHGVQAYLTPPGARRILGLPMGELTAQVVELEDLHVGRSRWPGRSCGRGEHQRRH